MPGGPVGRDIGVVMAVGQALLGDGGQGGRLRSGRSRACASTAWRASGRWAVDAREGVLRAFAEQRIGWRAGWRAKAIGCRASSARRDLPGRVRAAGKPHLAELLNRTSESSIVDSVVNFEFNTASISDSDEFEIATSIAGPALCSLAGMTGCRRANRSPTRCCGLHDKGLRLA